MGWKGVDSYRLAQYIDQGRARMNKREFRVPQNAENFLSIWATNSFSERTQLHVVSERVS
jgi:hypothetical protein